jgi:hypothetical protein
MVGKASENILEGIELERSEATLCEPASLTVLAIEVGCSPSGMMHLPARGSLAQWLHGECFHRIVLVPYLENFGCCRIVVER